MAGYATVEPLLFSMKITKITDFSRILRMSKHIATFLKEHPEAAFADPVAVRINLDGRMTSVVLSEQDRIELMKMIFEGMECMKRHPTGPERGGPDDR